MRTFEILDNCVQRDKHSANCEKCYNTTLSEALQGKDKIVHSLLGAVNYKPCTGRESQIDEHASLNQDATAQLKMS